VNLMLTVMFVCVLIGLLARDFGRREQLAVAAVATAMTALYYFFGARFM
jgi:predicted phage tail protein